jgi:CheY-like chemotaxis protein
VAKTLLAVDDSVTMRKVLEITFSGEDFNVITAEGHKDALAKLSEDPAVCIIDSALANEDGYALAKEVRKRNPSTTILLMSSRHNAYDAAKGKDAGVDDFMDKPFDTQQMIDKVRKAAGARDGGVSVSAATPAAAAKPAAAAASTTRGAVPPIEQRGTQPSLGGAAAGTRQRAATLMFGHEPTTGDLKVADAAPASVPVPAAAAAAKPEPAKVAEPVRRPTPMPVSNVPPATVAATPAALHSINGAMAPKLEGLGLTPAQADAVMALSREVIERVVWEVVPVIAEALIKEEIARLTKEG